MSFYNSAAYGVPLQPPTARHQQRYLPDDTDNDVQLDRNDTTGGDGSAPVREESTGSETGVTSDTILNPAFWATVFKTLKDNTDVAESIRRDVEEHESRRDADTRESGSHTLGADNNEPMEAFDDDDGGGRTLDDRPRRTNPVADMYDIVARGVTCPDSSTEGVKRLDALLDELDVEALWSSRDVTLSFGPLTRILVRLFVGPYATDEERLVVRMLALGVERASMNYGFQASSSSSSNGSAVKSTEQLYLTYRRRGYVLRDFAAFRYMLEIAEGMGRIGRKHKNDLILLYSTLTTPEVRLHRRWDADDREQVVAFRDRVTGFAMATPSAVARPMSVEMHLDSVFGNVTTNTRLLERSLVVALNNRNRKVANGGVTRDVELLLAGARYLDLSTTEKAGGDGGGATSPFAARSYDVKNENAAIRHMLESSVTVAMMAEEYRVFVAGAPVSRCGAAGSRGPNKRTSENISGGGTQQCTSRATTSRRPIFFTFKPTSKAVVPK